MDRLKQVKLRLEETPVDSEQGAYTLKFDVPWLIAEVEHMQEVLEDIRDYPPTGHPRRGEDGYPIEVVCDEFAYKGIVDTYRSAAKVGLREEESDEYTDGQRDSP